MSLKLTVLAENAKSEYFWVKALKGALSELDEVDIRAMSEDPALGQVVFLDGSSEESLQSVDQRLTEIEAHGGRGGRAVFLILKEGSLMPQALVDGRVDDVLVHPFRPIEVMGRLFHYQRFLAWNEVSDLNASFGEIVEQLHDDLRLAESLQKSRLPIRFPEVKGFKFISRYLAGVRSGGDYFDLAEAKSGNQLSILLSDSSSYGLSSAVITVLMRVAVKLSVDETRSCRETVRKIHNEILSALRETDQLSLFYGVISRRDLRLRYVNLGSSCAFHSAKGRGFTELPSQAGPVTRSSGISRAEESELELSAGDRLALVSDGFVEAAGGTAQVCSLLDRMRDQASVDSVNELVFKVKSKFKHSEDMPMQDCSAMIMDLDSKLLKLA